MTHQVWDRQVSDLADRGKPCSVFWTRPKARQRGYDASVPYKEGRPLAIKLHRCPTEWVKFGGHPCWKVQKALDEQGIEYEIIKGPLRRGQRDDLEQLSGQRKYPVIEFEDGTIYREESAAMAARIKEGKLFEGRDSAA